MRKICLPIDRVDGVLRQSATAHCNRQDCGRFWPLIADNDLRNMTPETKTILTNKEVIAVNQDKLGKAGFRLAQNGEAEVWVRPLDKGDYAIGLPNRGASEAEMTVKWADLRLGGKPKARDLWAHADRGRLADGFTAKVASPGVVMVRVSR